MKNKPTGRTKYKNAKEPITIDKQTILEPEMTYRNAATLLTKDTVSIMGMAGKEKYTDIKNENDFITLIRSGLPKTAMTHLMTVTDLSLTEMASITHTSDRTLRRYQPTQKLSPEQSERMIELAKLYSRGAEVFGTMDNFKEWMDTIILPLGNKKPKEFLDTSIGINLLMDELGKIEHGIFA